MRGTRRFPKRVALATTAVIAATMVATMGLASPAQATTRQESMALLALANVGKKACSVNSKGHTGFETSCTGYTGHGPAQYWCADFAKWVWAQEGAKGTSVLTAAARSFYTYAQDHGGVHSKPKVGDVAIFSNNGSTSDIHHVAVVTGWYDSGKMVTTVSGDWDGKGATEPAFASSSHVINSGSYKAAPHGHPGAMDMYIIGYVSPVL